MISLKLWSKLKTLMRKDTSSKTCTPKRNLKEEN